MKKYKDFMPSEESEVEDLREMQGPPPKDAAEALAHKKAWDEYYEKKDRQRKSYRDSASTIASKNSKSGGDYGAKMKRYDDAVKASDDLVDKIAEGEIADYKKKFKGSKKYDDALKDISATFRKGTKKAKPLSKRKDPVGYSSGGSVRGSGKARGVKPCKIC